MHDLTKKLIDRVAALTKSTKLDWRDGPSQNAYSFEAGGYIVTVDATNSGPMLVVSDGEGRELEALTGEELAEANSASGTDYETVVRDMHASARRAALGTDEAMENILQELAGRD